MHHSITIQQLGEGGVQAVCSCGWRSPVFGADKTTGTMDPLQHATEAADLHEWEMSLRLAVPDVLAPVLFIDRMWSFDSERPQSRKFPPVHSLQP